MRISDWSSDVCSSDLLDRNVARQFQMLLLILSHRHMRGLVGKDIGRLQHRIGVKAKRRAFAVLARFLLELRHAVQPAEPGGAVEQPGKLGMGGHARLVEQDGLRSEEHTSELQSLMRISYAVF